MLFRSSTEIYTTRHTLSLHDALPIFRTAILQSAAPDNMRGRLQGIFTVVVTGGPRLGDLFVGVIATAGALWAPPVLGGLVIVVLIALILRTHAGFREYDSARPTP